MRSTSGYASRPFSSPSHVTEDKLELTPAVPPSQITVTQAAADRLDSCFDELRRVLDDGRPVSWRSTA